jgi:hypothetical protein
MVPDTATRVWGLSSFNLKGGDLVVREGKQIVEIDGTTWEIPLTLARSRTVSPAADNSRASIE